MFVVQDEMPEETEREATQQHCNRHHNHVPTTHNTHAQLQRQQYEYEQQHQQQQQQQQSMALREKCGVVYTWQCEVFAGVFELYAIECELCADRPLCRLSEFAEHMRIWHTDDVCQEKFEFNDIIEENQILDEENHTLEMENIGVESVLENDDDHGDDEQFTDLMTEIFDSEPTTAIDENERDAHENDENEENNLAPFEQVLIATDASEEMLNETCGGMMLMNENEDYSEFDERTECTMSKYEGKIVEEFNCNEQEEEKEEDINESRIENENFENFENFEYTKTAHIANFDNIAIEEFLPEDLEQFSNEDFTQITDFIQVPDDIVDTITNVTDSGVSSGAETDDLPKMLNFNPRQSNVEFNANVTEELNTKEMPDNVSNDSNKDQEEEEEEFIEEEEEDEADILKEIEEEEEQQEEMKNNQMTIDPTLLDPQQQIDFGLDEPFTTHTKLTRDDTLRLIAFYKDHPRLWQQNHIEYHDTQLNRKSWQQITQKWNRFKPQHQLTKTEVRARIALLCQRYMKERERLNMNEESSDAARFLYYKELQFMDAQKPLQNRRRLCEQQNIKLVEIYEHYPMLWHNAQRFAKQPERRVEALRQISLELKLHDIHLTPYAVRQRLQALRKMYRIERVQQLQSQLEKKTYETKFKHFQSLQFLSKHIDPYICEICGKIFENFLVYKTHAVGACEKALNDIEIGNEKFGNLDSEAEEKSSSDKLNSNSMLPEEIISKTSPEINSNLVDSALEMSSEILSNRNGHDSDDENVGVKLKNKQADAENVTKTLPKVSTSQTKIKAIKNNEKIPRRKYNKQKTKETNLTKHVEDESKQTELNETEKGQMDAAGELIVKVQCEKMELSYDLRFDHNELRTTEGEKKEGTNVKKLTTRTKAPSSRRLNADQIHKLITLYRQQPQLWNSHHLDYKSRNLRMLAWRNITVKLNKMCQTRFNCTILHRKLTDLMKYYRRERQRIQQEHSCTKWAFYDDFNFLDVIHAPHTQLDKSLQHRRQQLQIIALYKAQPQLWNTENVEFRQRRLRQRHILRLCQRLQHECRIVMKPAHVKQRLTDMRSAYRNEKQRRLFAEQCHETFSTRYEYYDALEFLDAHVAPFVCTVCSAKFKKLSEYTKHIRKLHSENAEQQAKIVALKHICHICGIKFTMRSNLLFHLKRHLHKGQHACSLCPKTFHSTTALRVHMRYHTKDYPYMCENCGMSYVNASKLNQHMKRHRNQRDYACSKCSRAFFTAFDLDRHERRHLNIRDKICPVCGKAFYPGSSYYAHMMLHSDEKRFKCDACGLKFAQYAGLYKHRKRYHPTTT